MRLLSFAKVLDVHIEAIVIAPAIEPAMDVRGELRPVVTARSFNRVPTRHYSGAWPLSQPLHAP